MDNYQQFKNLLSLKLASAVQKALLDDQIQNFHCGSIAVNNRMCDAIGGDFYYLNQLNDDQVAFAIGDVVGHGTSAALVMTLIMGALRADKPNNSRPAQIVHNVNNMLIRLGQQAKEHITCSMIYGVVDLPSRILFYVNAGHPEPVISNRITHNIHKLNPTTMLLGVQAGVRSESCHNFDQGDRLVLFTDGLTEAQNAQEQLLGQKRFHEFISELIDETPKEFTEQLIKRVESFTHKVTQQDDQTLVVIDFHNFAS